MIARAQNQSSVGPDDRVLGFTALGVEASEMVAVVQMAMIGVIPTIALRDAIFTHWTAKAMVFLFANALCHLDSSHFLGGLCRVFGASA